MLVEKKIAKTFGELQVLSSFYPVASDGRAIVKLHVKLPGGRCAYSREWSDGNRESWPMAASAPIIAIFWEYKEPKLPPAKLMYAPRPAQVKKTHRHLPAIHNLTVREAYEEWRMQKKRRVWRPQA